MFSAKKLIEFGAKMAQNSMRFSWTSLDLDLDLDLDEDGKVSTPWRSAIEDGSARSSGVVAGVAAPRYRLARGRSLLNEH